MTPKMFAKKTRISDLALQGGLRPQSRFKIQNSRNSRAEKLAKKTRICDRAM
jgi:hypothetical protein